MQFNKELSQRVLVLDGAMGTMIQRHNLTENDFRGTRFANHSVNLKGCNDLLCLTRPDIIADIHRQYLLAGADIIETNSFNANTLSMGEYQLDDSVVDEINLAAARLARAEVDRLKAENGHIAWVAGSVGPGNISLSIAATTAAGHKFTFDEVAEAYRRQAAKLIEGGVDLLLLETIFDTLNAKASIYGVRRAIAESSRPDIPLMISVTLTERGRTLSGQTLKAFVASIAHANPIAVGLNCGFGADMMAPFIEQLQDIPFYVSIHPNAGLPDEMGLYTETPESMAATIASYLQRGWLNIVGGCCGTTPAHIAAIVREAAKAYPRIKPAET
ncbi:MAG: homocysteine S-methyltransferase family protein, partial [Muribaculaceae bacterium]|nr:homocysteine S-methyltransferase family protein [Muribaculaceae bacterium]